MRLIQDIAINAVISAENAVGVEQKERKGRKGGLRKGPSTTNLSRLDPADISGAEGALFCRFKTPPSLQKQCRTAIQGCLLQNHTIVPYAS